MNLINFKYALKGKKNVNTSRERKIRIYVFLCAVKVNSNHGIRLKRRMSFFIWPPLFLCNMRRSQRKTTKEILQNSG